LYERVKSDIHAGYADCAGHWKGVDTIMMPSTPPPFESPLTSPPSRVHLDQIAAAKVLGKKISRAIATAKFSGWTIGIFAAVTFLGGLAGSLSALILGAAMGAITYYELRGANEMKRLDRTAPKRLAMNQIVFALMLIAYAGYELMSTLREPINLSSYGADPQVAAQIQSMERPLAIIVYVSVMIAAILGPGLTAIYYYTRAKYIDRYVQNTPTWILDLQRAGMSI
jgi:hypothetical protein